MKTTDMVAVIPARIGSKGIPRKNLADFAGKPLLAWTIEAARQSGVFGRIIVSTDSPEVAEVARAFGAETPFMRPAPLASDEVHAVHVVLHALDWLQTYEALEPAGVMMLLPTCPLRSALDIQRAVELFRSRAASAVIGVADLGKYMTNLRYLRGERLEVVAPEVERNAQRQGLDKLFGVNGALFLAEPSALRRAGTFHMEGALGYAMDPIRSVDINAPEDLQLAATLFQALSLSGQAPTRSTSLSPPDAGIPDSPRKKRLLHIGVHHSANRNAGDTLLFPVVRTLFDVLLGPFDWALRQAWEPFDVEDAERVNAAFDGIVIGGGGLLLRDQAGSDVGNSGWQWNSSVAAVERIDVPLIVFAIGYNRFRGQEDFDPIFTPHLRAVAGKSQFFGLRNSGSIRAVSAYLPEALRPVLRRQYCPTTVLWQLYPEYRALAEAHDRDASRVFVLNAAFDRASLRFGSQAAEVLANVANAVLVAQQRGWEIVVVAHKTLDRDIEPYLEAAGVHYRTVDLTDGGPERIMAFYAGVDFVFGMRGHAQMIPFGLRRPIMSLISHDKMRYFLEDIGRPQWGVEVTARDMALRLGEALERVENDREALRADLAGVQSAVWEETRKNIQAIGAAMSRPTPGAGGLDDLGYNQNGGR